MDDILQDIRQKVEEMPSEAEGPLQALEELPAEVDGLREGMGGLAEAGVSRFIMGSLHCFGNKGTSPWLFFFFFFFFVRDKEYSEILKGKTSCRFHRILPVLNVHFLALEVHF
jgi:hypothetical protein